MNVEQADPNPPEMEGQECPVPAETKEQWKLSGLQPLMQYVEAGVSFRQPWRTPEEGRMKQVATRRVWQRKGV